MTKSLDQAKIHSEQQREEDYRFMMEQIIAQNNLLRNHFLKAALITMLISLVSVLINLGIISFREIGLGSTTIHVESLVWVRVLLIGFALVMVLVVLSIVGNFWENNARMLFLSDDCGYACAKLWVKSSDYRSQLSGGLSITLFERIRTGLLVFFLVFAGVLPIATFIWSLV